MTEQLDEMDRHIRDDLFRATEHVTSTDVGHLAASFEQRRRGIDARSGTGGHGRREHHRGSRGLSAAAVVVVVSGVVGALVFANRPSTQRITTSPPTSGVVPDDNPGPEVSSGFDDWESGWHELDMGPVPRGAEYATTWYRGRLVIAANDYAALGDVGWVTRLWSYDPEERSWTELPSPGLVRIGIVAAGDQLVAVGVEDGDEPNTVPPLADRWATWTYGDYSWQDRGLLPRSERFATEDVVAAGVNGTLAGSPLLVWTGSALLDFMRGQVMNPLTGEVVPLALPDDIAESGPFVGTRPVWTGRQVVWLNTDLGTGLVWSPTGDRVTSFTVTDRVDRTNPDVRGRVAKETMNFFGADERVVVVEAYSGGDPYASYAEITAIDPATGRSTRIDSLDELPVPGCIIGAMTEGGRLLAIPCARKDRSVGPVLLSGDRWTPVDPLPGIADLVNTNREATIVNINPLPDRNLMDGGREAWMTAVGRSVVLFSVLVPGDWVHTDRSGDEWLPRAMVWVPDR